MTLAEAKKRWWDIEQCKGDDEGAHGMEDGFREDVLRHLLTVVPDDSEAAAIIRVALNTSEIEFCRWCA
jgi:hypothetical protein